MCVFLILYHSEYLPCAFIEGSGCDCQSVGTHFDYFGFLNRKKIQIQDSTDNSKITIRKPN